MALLGGTGRAKHRLLRIPAKPCRASKNSTSRNASWYSPRISAATLKMSA